MGISNRHARVGIVILCRELDGEDRLFAVVTITVEVGIHIIFQTIFQTVGGDTVINNILQYWLGSSQIAFMHKYLCFQRLGSPEVSPAGSILRGRKIADSDINVSQHIRIDIYIVVHLGIIVGVGLIHPWKIGTEHPDTFEIKHSPEKMELSVTFLLERF